MLSSPGTDKFAVTVNSAVVSSAITALNDAPTSIVATPIEIDFIKEFFIFHKPPKIPLQRRKRVPHCNELKYYSEIVLLCTSAQEFIVFVLPQTKAEIFLVFARFSAISSTVTFSPFTTFV